MELTIDWKEFDAQQKAAVKEDLDMQPNQETRHDWQGEEKPYTPQKNARPEGEKSTDGETTQVPSTDVPASH